MAAPTPGRSIGADLNSAYDAVVVGAGYIGCSVAYHLAVAGVRTALVDRVGVGAGASTANYGNVQVQDAELDYSLGLVTAGYAEFADLEARLGRPVGLRRLGSLLLIETEAQWEVMAARLPRLHAAGIQAELVGADDLRTLEPMLDATSLLGACYHAGEGQVNPFRLLWAFVAGGLEAGLHLHCGVEVLGFEASGGRVRGVRTSGGLIAAGRVILCTGAWTPALGRSLGRSWAIPQVHGQAVITEGAAPRLNNHLASAAFFESIQAEGEPDDDAAVLAVSQTADGHFLLGEAGAPLAALRGDARPAGQAAIASLALRYLPALRGIRVLRGWAAPVAFTADGLPFFGPVGGVDGLFLATAFKSTVIVTPLVGRTVAQWVLDGHTDLDLSAFAPDRVSLYAG